MTGTEIHGSGAGSVLGPSHQTGRPIVRLETATASTQAKTDAQVMTITPRQPLPGSAGARPLLVTP